MNLMIDDKKLRNNFKEWSIQRANDFRVGKIIKEYEEIICID